MELILFAGAIALSLFLLRGRFLRTYPWEIALVMVSLLGTGAMIWTSRVSSHVQSYQSLKREIPAVNAEGGYVSSATCRSCHPAQYETWHDSYHRAMTQEATPETVKGNFDNVSLPTWYHDYFLERKGDEFWVRTDDEGWEELPVTPKTLSDTRVPEDKITRKRILMTTGSHHYQVYWAASSNGREMFNLPFIYLLKEKRWVPREFGFMIPHNGDRIRGLWNGNCLRCHTTGGIPGVDFDLPIEERKARSRVTELGIACESCHGPAEEHVRVNRDPLNRYKAHFRKGPDPTIVNPAKLSNEASSHVCAQCHSYNIILNVKNYSTFGPPYRPGGDLNESRLIVRYLHNAQNAAVKEWYTEQYLQERIFWPDGMIRITGREYNAMIESTCHVGGKLTCITCHSMHKYEDNNDQLAKDMDGDQSCFQCHEKDPEKIVEHTHHPLGSSGSSCLNCHMPHTNYGLMKAIRSHLIDSPSVDVAVESGRPNACNLCHLDKTLQWTADKLKEWHQRPTNSVLTDDQRNIADSVNMLLKGDANQRALIAWAMGWEPAIKASGTEWLPPYLAQLMDDPYPAVRFMAERSLRTLEGYENVDYDFTAPPAQRHVGAGWVLDNWKKSWPNPNRDHGPVLIDPKGTADQATWGRLLAVRNDRPVYLEE